MARGLPSHPPPWDGGLQWPGRAYAPKAPLGGCVTVPPGRRVPASESAPKAPLGGCLLYTSPSPRD
eukprot:10516181-Alexandrium_andersonii.AAC.1